MIAQLNQGHSLDYIDAPEDLFAALDDDVAVVYLTHINYRNGRMLDMAAVTEAAHAAGALMIWDLAHSTGAVPLSVAETGVDFAVGCTYKYLNGGPGAPAFLYVADGHLGRVFQPLSGWFARQSPFEFDPVYKPATTVNQFLCGTPPILSAAALNAALDIWQI